MNAALAGAGTLLAIVIFAMLLPAGADAAGQLCTDSWTGPAEGNWQTAADWSNGQLPTSLDVACIPAGDTVTVTGASQAGVLEGEGALVLAGGLLETASALEASSIASLALRGGTLSLAGELEVGSALTGGGGSTTVSGAGELVVGSGATGTIGERCARLVLDEATLVNQGTLTSGGAGGAPDGAIWMENGAQLQNAGTFADDSTEPGGCGFGRVPSVFDNGGSSAPSIVNTGTFQSDDTEEPVTIGVPLENQGTVGPLAGTLQLAGGGGEGASGGAFAAASGTALEFTGGAFALSGAKWSGPGTIAVAGASVTAASL
ncbi:MAG TPA: hypothetical protein VGY13_03445, partial [Solirubrobacteraceae bacterium]|nr:hypothetical protein [Solirubrobacteraceae bacterium]